MADAVVETVVSVETLRGWMRRVLQRYGMFAADAELVIQRLLDAELRGRKELGVTLLAEIANAFDSGDIDPRARTLTVQETPAFAVLDGSTGVGQANVTRAMQLAMQKAQAVGVGIVVVTNSQPCGDVAGYAELAAQSGCLGFCTTNSGKASRAIVPNGPAVFADHAQAWAVPVGDKAWVACERTGTSDEAMTTVSGTIRGVISLLLTAGLAGTRLPAAKRKASPYGAGAEHTCLALHLPTWQAADNCRKVWTELAPLLGESGAGWHMVELATESSEVTLSPTTLATLQDVAQQTKIAWVV